MNIFPVFHAFTNTSTGLIRQIITEIGISLPFGVTSIDKNDERIEWTRALWDTGATNSVVTKNTAKKLDLKPISLTKVTHADGTSIAKVFLVNLYLPNKLIIQNVRVTECSDAAGNFGVIIGMDIITTGDLSITNKDFKSVVSFRIPCIRTIDYVKEANEQNKAQLRLKEGKIGRNDPCPCGSGKKYKNCHSKKS